MRAQHEITSSLSADQIEALEEPTMYFGPSSAMVNSDDYVIITSADGCIFLGTVEDVDDDGRFSVEMT